MFTMPFWVVFAICILISFGVCLAYGRRAIHPRLRPHFGQVVLVFVVLAMVSFVVAVVLGTLIGVEETKPKSPEIEASGTDAIPSEPAPEPAKPALAPAPPAEPAPAPEMPN